VDWVIICDEVSALGWRLAGARPLIAEERNLQERLAEARQHAELVFITADLGKRLPDSVLSAALLAEKPLMAVIVAPQSGEEPPDLEQQARHLLGIAV